MKKITHILAVDGGGTSCRARLCHLDGRIISEARGGPANINTNFDQASANISSTTESAYAQARDAGVPVSLEDAVAYLGLAGVNISNRGPELEARFGAAYCHVRSDLYTTVEGALGSRDGMVALFGTGSLFAARHGSDMRHIGGWGFQLGDLGSGAWAGREVLRLSIRAQDGLRAHSDLSRELMKELDGPAGAAEFALKASPQDFGTFAPRVLRAALEGDALGVEIKDMIVDEIRAARAVLKAQSDSYCIVGGLGELITSLLPEDLSADVIKPEGTPLDGAVSLAQKLEQSTRCTRSTQAPK